VTALEAIAEPDSERAERLADLALVVLLTFLTVLVAGFAIFFLPMWAGTVALPVSSLVGAVVVFVNVRLCFRLRNSMAAALAPALAWFLTTLTLATSTTLGYPLMRQDWRFLLLFGIGTLAASTAVATSWGHRALAGRPAAGMSRTTVQRDASGLSAGDT
jgi:hypothetical protein